jgi:predicted RNA binding protein YcfA (HicA-like mRNA interferase family)
MDADEISRCRSDLQGLRRKTANIARDDVERLVLRLGYALRPKKGGHPVYVKPGRLPLTIPGHRNALNRFTVRGILDRLEEDLDREEEGQQHGD